MSRTNGLRIVLLSLLVAAVVTLPAAAQCDPEEPLENHTGGGQVTCTCFDPGEEAGSIFDIPPGDYPIEILSVGIGWASAATGQPDSLEQAFHIYEGTIPNPGAPIFTQEGPVLVDGAINLFDVEFLPGEVIVNSGPFMVTLEFANQNAGGGSFTPSVIHDGNGCQSGKNSVYAPGLGGWFDACVLSVSGDWVFVVNYRKVNCGQSGPGSVPDGNVLAGSPLRIDRGAGGTLDLFWGGSCSPTDTDYSVYEGTLAGLPGYDHLPKSCGTGSTSANVSPSGGDTYYLVVPRDASNEGSYGLDSSQTPRPEAIATCRPPLTSSCP